MRKIALGCLGAVLVMVATPIVVYKLFFGGAISTTVQPEQSPALRCAPVRQRVYRSCENTKGNNCSQLASVAFRECLAERTEPDKTITVFGVMKEHPVLITLLVVSVVLGIALVRVAKIATAPRPTEQAALEMAGQISSVLGGISGLLGRFRRSEEE